MVHHPVFSVPPLLICVVGWNGEKRNGHNKRKNKSRQRSTRGECKSRNTKIFHLKRMWATKQVHLESTKNGAEETPCLRACWCLLWRGQQFSHWTTLPVARPTSQAATHAGTSARVPGHSQNRVVEWPNHFAGVVGWGRLTGAAPHWAEWPKGCFHYSCRAGGIDVVWGLKKFHYLQKNALTGFMLFLVSSLMKLSQVGVPWGSVYKKYIWYYYSIGSLLIVRPTKCIGTLNFTDMNLTFVVINPLIVCLSIEGRLTQGNTGCHKRVCLLLVDHIQVCMLEMQWNLVCHAEEDSSDCSNRHMVANFWLTSVH